MKSRDSVASLLSDIETVSVAVLYCSERTFEKKKIIYFWPLPSDLNKFWLILSLNQTLNVQLGIKASTNTTFALETSDLVTCISMSLFMFT